MTSKDWEKLEKELFALWMDPRDGEHQARKLRDILLRWVREQREKAELEERKAADMW